MALAQILCGAEVELVARQAEAMTAPRRIFSLKVILGDVGWKEEVVMV